MYMRELEKVVADKALKASNLQGGFLDMFCLARRAVCAGQLTTLHISNALSPKD